MLQYSWCPPHSLCRLSSGHLRFSVSSITISSNTSSQVRDKTHIPYLSEWREFRVSFWNNFHDGGSAGLVYFSVLRKFAWSLQHLTSDGTSSGKNFWILLTEWIFVILFWEGELHISILLRWAMSQWVQIDDFKDYYFKSVEAICHMSFLERVNCLFAKVFLYAEM